MVLKVGYKTYKNIACDHRDKSVPCFTYSNGLLEIVVPLEEHEELGSALDLLIVMICLEWQIDFRGLRSTTFQRDDLQKGFEPDLSYYVQNLPQVFGKKEINLLVDPAPDLLVEVDITSPSLDKLPLYARLGVPEVWWQTKGQSRILRLDAGAYVDSEFSVVFPLLPADVVRRFLLTFDETPRQRWLREIREWARERLPATK